MARSRRQESSALRFVPVARVFVICTLLGGAGVGYVWQKEQIGRLSQQIHEQEDRLAEQLAENDNRRKQLVSMRSVGFLEKKIKELNLGLTVPQPTQVWRLVEPPRTAAKPGREAQWAVEDDRLPGGPRTNAPLGP